MGDAEREATRRLRQCRDIQSAWDLLEALPTRMLRVNSFHLGAFCGACGQLRAWQKAYDAMELMKSRTILTDLIAHNAALASMPDWRKCFQAFQTQACYDQISINSCIYSCAKELHWTGSMQLLLTIRSLRHLAMDVYGFSSTIGAFSNNNNNNSVQHWRRAWMLLSSMETPEEFSLASAAQMPYQSWFKSFELLESMRLHLLCNNEVMYGSVLSSCETASQWLEAFQVLDLAVSQRLSSLISFSSALSAGEKAAQWHAPLHLFLQMSNWLILPDEICYGAMISACDKGGQWDSALILLTDALRHRLAQDIITWNSAMSACERRRRWPHTLELLSTTAGSGDRHSITAACSACGKGGLWQRALSLSEALQAKDLVLYNTLVLRLRSWFGHWPSNTARGGAATLRGGEWSLFWFALSHVPELGRYQLIAGDLASTAWKGSTRLGQSVVVSWALPKEKWCLDFFGHWLGRTNSTLQLTDSQVKDLTLPLQHSFWQVGAKARHCLPSAKRFCAKGYQENDKTMTMAPLGFINEDVKTAG